MKTLLTFTLFILVSLSFFSQTNRIDVNSINALIQAEGTQFHDIGSTTPGFEALIGTGQSSIFASSIWMGGLRTDSTLGLIYQTYIDTNTQSEFSTGPLACVPLSGTFPKKDFGAATIDSIEKIKWNKTFCVSKNEVEEFKRWFACTQDASCNAAVKFPGYSIPSSITSWPAHGDHSLFQDAYLAPFWDNDADGFYDPSSGDFPCIKGDKYCWFILNDRGYDSSSLSMGLEIHVEAYSFVKDSSNPVGRTLFLGYDIINRSTDTFLNFRVAQQTDFDLGCAQDDYIGSMPSLNSYYAYNADAIDDNCSGGAVPYGINPPAQGVTFLNQTMTKSKYYNNSTGNQGDPSNHAEAYQYMNGNWKDGTTQKYHNTSIAADHMYPYIPPTGMSAWTEYSAGNPAGDRRFLGSVGGFTLTPGDVIEVDLAFTFSRSDSGNLKSVDQLYRDIQVVQAFYNDSIKLCSDSLIGYTRLLEQKSNEISFSIYPNPANEFFSITMDSDESFNVRIIDTQGKTVIEKQNIRTNEQIDLPSLSSGVYFVKLTNESNQFKMKKLVIQ